MSSGSLVPQENFAQTGTIDWVRLGDGLVSFSIKALARMARYRVDLLTIVLGRQIAQQFRLSPEGEGRVKKTISELSSYPGFGSKLFFGFDASSIPMQLAPYADGLALVALSASLSDVYNEDVATQVLNEILLLHNPPRESTPSLQSWSKLVKACSGTFAKTQFSTKAEDFMRLHPSQTSIFPLGDTAAVDQSWRSRSSSKDIAIALITLGKVSRAEIESITIAGGGDVGFLAAIAEWLFDMDIAILDGNGNILYLSPNSGPVVQVRFIFEDRNSASSSSSSSTRSKEIEAFHYPSKVIRLKDVSDIIYANDKNSEMQVSGRLDWDRCLSPTFGTAFDRLRTLKSNLGTAIGCAARIFEAIVKAERVIDLQTRKNWIYYSDGGSGHGFVQNLVYWFPELRVAETRAQQAAEFSYIEARNQYESAIAILAENCSCPYCTLHPNRQTQNTHCLVLVTETILKAALTLSNVSVAPGLRPKRSGINELYENHRVFTISRMSDDDARQRKEEKLGSMVWVVEPERDDEYSYKLYTVGHRVRLMIDGAMRIFTFVKEQRDSWKSDSWASATSSGGICGFRDILRGLSTHDDIGCSLGRFHIVPGRIMWQEKAFNRVLDWYQDSDHEFCMDDEQIDTQEMDFQNVSMRMEEGLKELNVAYRVLNSKNNVLHIPPVLLANHALASLGLIRCHRRHGPNRTPQALDEHSRFLVQRSHGKMVSHYLVPDETTLCATLIITELLSSRYFVLWGDECSECSLVRAVSDVHSAFRSAFGSLVSS